MRGGWWATGGEWWVGSGEWWMLHGGWWQMAGGECLVALDCWNEVLCVCV